MTTLLQLFVPNADPDVIIREVRVSGLALIMLEEYEHVRAQIPDWYADIEKIGLALSSRRIGGLFLSVDSIGIYSITCGSVTALYYVSDKSTACIISLTKPS